MANKALWLAFRGAMDLTSNQVFSIVKHFLEGSDLFISMIPELLTKENISTITLAITAIIRTVVWLRSEEWLTEALKIFISKTIPNMTLLEHVSITSDLQLVTFLEFSPGIEVFETH